MIVPSPWFGKAQSQVSYQSQQSPGYNPMHESYQLRPKLGGYFRGEGCFARDSGTVTAHNHKYQTRYRCSLLLFTLHTDRLPLARATLSKLILAPHSPWQAPRHHRHLEQRSFPLPIHLSRNSRRCDNSYSSIRRRLTNLAFSYKEPN
jgi:hypothetical protein